MKNLISPLILLLFCVSISAQTIDPSSQKLIDDFVKNSVEFQLEYIDQTAICKVFSGKFYKINIFFVETGSGANSCGSDNYVNVNGSVISMIEPVHMDLECPVLLSLVRKDFLLTNENSATLFENALNVLYPEDENEIQNIKHLRKDSQWIFLRGKFFDDSTAFIATTGPEGEILKIDLVLSFSVN
ncbi:MAG TPA: hypothetical protein DEO33_02525 [Rikenellaceae bacterium]|nr:hypothetical protein [Rikenellaceae bacterium]